MAKNINRIVLTIDCGSRQDNANLQAQIARIVSVIYSVLRLEREATALPIQVSLSRET